MADIYDWSTTAASNGAADADINWAEGQNPDTVNDSARKMMARVAEFRLDLAPTRTSAGSSNAYTVTSNAVASGAYNEGEIISFVADRANTSACTLNVNGRGAVAFRPEIGREFAAGEIRANQPVLAFYRTASNEFLAVGSGYHVNAMTSGLLTQSITSRLLRIGDPVLSISPTVAPGRIRLTESTQTLYKSDWPELSSWLSGLSSPYPWGSTSTTFNLPPAAGYFLRFAALSSAVDPGGARAAGVTQGDQVKSHTHASGTLSGVTGNAGAHLHQVVNQGSTSAGSGINSVAGTGLDNTTLAPDHAHSVTINGGSTASNDAAATENRPKNISMHVEIIASSALTAGTLGMYGFPYTWDTSTTASDPGSGRVKVNNATFASVTEIYISETDGWSVGIGGLMGAVSGGAVIRISQVGAQGNSIVLQATGAGTDNGTYRTYAVSVLASAGSIALNASVAVEFFPSGAAGAAGANGSDGADGSNGADGEDAGAFRWTYSSTTTTNVDPGTGLLRFNNATLASATELAISYATAETGNPSVEDWVASWDDSTNTANYGTLIVKKQAAVENFAVFAITSTITDGTTYGRYTVDYVSGAGTIADTDVLHVQFIRTGNKGSDGVGAGDVTAASAFTNDNRALRSDGTGKGAQASSVTIDDSGNVSGVGTLVTSGVVTAGTTSATAVKIDPSGFVEIPEIAAPATPSSGFVRLYAKTDGKAYQKDDAGTETDLSQSGGGSSASDTVLSSGRLTLTSGTPITTADVTGATTVYYTPYNGNGISLYDGSAWVGVSFSEVSIKLTDAQTGTRASTGNGIITGLTDTSQLVVGMEASGTGIGASAVISSIDSATQVTLSVNNTATGTATVTFKAATSTPYDVFGKLVSGALKLELVKWSSDTVRATDIAIQDGIKIKSGDATRRWLGSVRVMAAGTTYDSNLYRMLFNAHNRAPRKLVLRETTASWTYATASWRNANGNGANIVYFFCGEETPVAASLRANASNSTSTVRSAYSSIGLDSGASPSSDCNTGYAAVDVYVSPLIADYLGTPGIGLHYLSWLELAAGADTQTFYGTGFNCGLTGMVMA